MTKCINKTTLKAQDIFLELLPNPLSARENLSDYGIDYDILSAATCAVHIKGTTKPNYCQEYVSCVIETSKLDYYRQKNKPVFIMLVDTILQKVYWLFIQEYIEEVLEAQQPNWHSKKTVNLKIPTANNLEDAVSKFSDAILRASNLMLLYQYKHPFLTVATSLQSAVNDPQPLEHQHNSCSSTSCSCSATNEMSFTQDYLIAAEKTYQQYIISLNQRDHQRCFTAVQDLTDSILKTVDEGEYFTTAELTLRLADIYFSAFTHLSKTVGAKKAFILMDLGQVLLDKVHELMTELETPSRVIN
jgi:hypothetical protein